MTEDELITRVQAVVSRLGRYDCKLTTTSEDDQSLNILKAEHLRLSTTNNANHRPTLYQLTQNGGVIKRRNRLRSS